MFLLSYVVISKALDKQIDRKKCKHYGKPIILNSQWCITDMTQAIALESDVCY